MSFMLYVNDVLAPCMYISIRDSLFFSPSLLSTQCLVPLMCTELYRVKTRFRISLCFDLRFLFTP